MFKRRTKEKVPVQVINYKVIHIDYEVVYKYESNIESFKEFNRTETIENNENTVIVNLYDENTVNVF